MAVHGVGKIRRPVRRASAWRDRTRARRTREALASGRRAARESSSGARVRQPDRDRPGLRPPQGRRRASRGRCARSTRASARWLAGLRRGRPARRDRPITASIRRTPGTDHTREYAPLLALTGEMARAGRRAGAARAAATTARSPTSARRVLRWLTGRARRLPGGLSCAGARVHKLGGCPSFPRSRRSAASSRRWSRGGGSSGWRSSTRAGRARSRPRELADALAGRRVERLGRRGKYLLWDLERRRVPGPAPAHDRRGAAATRRARSRAHVRVRMDARSGRRSALR